MWKVFLLTFLSIGAFGHHRGHGGPPGFGPFGGHSGSSEESFQLPTISVEAFLRQKLRPLLGKLESKYDSHVCLSDEAARALCVGEAELADGKLETALDECGVEARNIDISDLESGCSKELSNHLCVFKGIDWLNETGGIQRENVQTDLMNVAISDRLEGVEDACWTTKEAITEEALKDVVEGGPCSTGPLIAAVSRHFGFGGQHFGFGFHFQAPTLTEEDYEEVVQLVQNLVYFSCIHEAFEEKCTAEANEVVLNFAMERDSATTTDTTTDSTTNPTTVSDSTTASTTASASTLRTALNERRWLGQQRQISKWGPCPPRCLAALSDSIDASTTASTTTT